MNIAKKVMNLNVYLIKQKENIHMSTLYENLGGKIFNYIDLNTGEVKPDKFLLLVNVKTNMILNFYSDDKLLNKEVKRYAKLISVSTSNMQNPFCRNGTPIYMINGGKSITLTIDINGIETVLEGELENFNLTHDYAIIGFSCTYKEFSYKY